MTQHDELYAALETAARLADRFATEHGRPLTAADVALVALLPEGGAAPSSTNVETPAPASRAAATDDTPEDGPLVGDLPDCPVCGSPMWDNRARKASGEYKPAAPDMACKDRACTGRIWKLMQKHMKTSEDIPTAAPVGPSPFDNDDDDLPF